LIPQFFVMEAAAARARAGVPAVQELLETSRYLAVEADLLILCHHIAGEAEVAFLGLAGLPMVQELASAVVAALSQISPPMAAGVVVRLYRGSPLFLVSH